MEITQLPYDILVQIAGLIRFNDFCKLARTCQVMYEVSNDNNIWRDKYNVYFGNTIKIDEKIPTWKEKYYIKSIEREMDVKLFNANPTVLPGLEKINNKNSHFQIEKYSVNFLQDKNVSRVARGIYLSFIDKRTQGLLYAYFETLDFKGKSVLECLSLMLNYIQFPSHFSVITKFMLCFSQRYFICNSGDSIFKTHDAVYVLAFGIIMLNTDIHNSAVKNKMTLSQYLQNSSGINSGENLPEKMLIDIYNRIKEKPLVFNNNKLSEKYESSLWSWVSDWITKLRT